MKNLREHIESINEKTMEMSKNIERVMRISKDIYEKDEFDRKLYGETMVIEEEINLLEVDIREECIKTIAMFQPAASDLRALVGFMDIAKFLERIADLLKGNLKLLKRISKQGIMLDSNIKSVIEMSDKVHSIYELYLNAFSNGDLSSVYMLFGMDEEIDECRVKIIEEVKEKIREDNSYLDLAVEILLISYKVERISDKIMNLAKSLVYIYKGEDMRQKEIEAGKS